MANGERDAGEKIATLHAHCLEAKFVIGMWEGVRPGHAGHGSSRAEADGGILYTDLTVSGERSLAPALQGFSIEEGLPFGWLGRECSGEYHGQQGKKWHRYRYITSGYFSGRPSALRAAV